MRIREITANDIDQCAQVFMAAYNRLPWNYGWKQEKAAKYLREYLGAPGFAGFLAIDNDQVVAAMFGHIKTWWTNDQLVIDELFVDAASQGKGYGKHLMEHCEQYCREKSLEMIVLMTNKFMPAYNFYLSNDYVKVDQYVFMFKQV